MWPPKAVYLLLEKYEERMNEFSSGIKRHSKIWENIANNMNKVDSNITISGPQCQSKMNGMKKMYRKIIDHNKYLEVIENHGNILRYILSTMIISQIFFYYTHIYSFLTLI